MPTLKIHALVLTAIAFVPSAAHRFELPGKIDLPREAYFVVQGIYAGWAMFAVPIFAAILANVALSVTLWRQRDWRAAAALVSALLIAGSLGLFLIWVFPGNTGTENWTRQPENWELLRRNWEFGHAADAVIVFAAFIATCVGAIGGHTSANESEGRA